MEPSRDLTFPRSARLLSRDEFSRVRSKGKAHHSKYFVVLIVARSDGPTRLGLTVSRKVGGAVKRNHVKRRLREFFRLNHGRLGSHLDISIIAKRGSHELSLDDVCKQLHFLLA